MNGAQAVAAALKAEDVSSIAAFPHNQIIDAAAEIGIRPIIARTERVAANIADGCSRMSDGRSIGVCAVQYGPGIENVFGAVAQAYADSSPILVVTGGYDSHEAGVVPNFEAAASYRAVTKWVASVNHVERIPQIMAHAFAKLRSGKGGPVVIEVPDDLMAAELPADAPGYVKPALSGPSAAGDMGAILSALLASRSPLIVAGQGVLYGRACEELKAFAELLELPVMTTLAGKSAFPESHELSLGTGGASRSPMVDRWLAESDFVLGIGTSFTRSDYTTPVPLGKTVAQITNEPADIARSFPISLGVVADARAALTALIAEAGRNTGKASPWSGVGRRIAAAREEFLRAWRPRLACDDAPISPYRVISDLMHTVDRARTMVTHDSGNPRDQMVPFYEALVPRGYLGWGKSTQLGTGLGLAMGCKLARPDWLAVNVMGDAAFGMVGMDFETAVRCDLPILTVVLNNGLMGGYEEHLPIATKRYRAHHLSGDYAAVARALGGHAETVTKAGDVGPALERAIAKVENGQAALVEVQTREEPVFAPAG